MACEQHIVNSIASTDYVDCVVSAVSGTLQNKIYNTYIRDERSSGTSAGSPASGWNTRVLNTVVFDETGVVSLSSNQFTLPAGTYFINAASYISQSNGHRLRLRNITDSTTTLLGLSLGGGGLYFDLLSGKFTIVESKTFAIQYYSSGTTGSLGVPVSTGDVEIYAEVHLQKVT